MYNKLFTKILDSSIWLESSPTRIVWLTFLAVMDEAGFVQFAAVGNVANRARVTVEEAQEAIRALENPDPESSDPENEGRRIERVPGGWMVLNAAKHRELVTRAVRQEQTRERVARHRALKRISNASVTPSVSGSVSEALKPIDRLLTPRPTHAAFDDFWADYPRKVGKGAALKVWQALNPSQAVVTQIAEALRWQKTQNQWTRDGGQFIPHPATWLRQARWVDEPLGRAGSKL